ncbi:hypothetical protein GAYE_SCF06G2737 [Galdieria yellowstonensis]|uniref:phosphatidylserine decarboxylase n=1 Tax=Galdieria yellowstonensis TaxID=3028027 RepID=A0AAV9IBK0_9RHOD|nr:hypothetical protein GAYE_SCF06G2737 [Galdieria yellowstonensis]
MRFRHAVWMTLSMATATALATTVAVQKLDSDLNKQVQPFQPWVVQCLQNLPLKTVTSCWTWLGNRNLPPALREPTYRGYCNVFGCNVEEASEPLSNYQNLHQFFARSLKPGARVFQQHATLNAPSDGTIVNCGKIVNEQVEQVKGMTWKVTQLIPAQDWKRYKTGNNESLFFVITYLAPGDYHNFHSPCDWHIQQYRHRTGTLLPVAPALMKRVVGLLALNESVTLMGEWKYGILSMTAVGALNVGGIYLKRATITNDEDEKTIDWQLGKGDEVGGFRFGSALLLVFSAPSDFQFSVNTGDKVLCGDAIGFLQSENPNKTV